MPFLSLRNTQKYPEMYMKSPWADIMRCPNQIWLGKESKRIISLKPKTRQEKKKKKEVINKSHYH